MEALVVEGGRRLTGTREISGAKNAVLPILAATVVHGGTYLLHRCPDITDVRLAGEIIETLGGTVRRRGRSLLVDTRGVERWQVPAALMARMRASVLFLGALLARFQRAELTVPGGCPLGRRPIDLHLQAMAALGAAVSLAEQEICCTAEGLHGGIIRLPVPSVGATENAMLAACGTAETVIIENAAREPEISDLADFLRTIGAAVAGDGTSTLAVRGGGPFHDGVHTVLPDRIETATYLCACAACGGRVTLTGTDGRLLLPVLERLELAGCRTEYRQDWIKLTAPKRLRGGWQVVTAPYPGFPTDGQALLMAAALRAEGETCFSEGIFSNRFSHVPQLRKLGGDICLTGCSALVRGTERLHGAQLAAGDLRAAAALILGALQAPEESTILGLKHLDRGYDNLEGGLRQLGARVNRRTDKKQLEFSSDMVYNIL